MKRIDPEKYPYPGRIRHHVSPNLYFPLDELKKKPKNYPPVYDELDWNECFENGNPPDALDIGCGKGLFLFEFAIWNPEINILGIEVRKQIVDWNSEVIEGEQLGNCANIWYSVANGLPFIENSSISKVFYLFPDPWVKRRQMKRRAFNESLLEEIHRIMKPYGSLYLASDIKEVHDYHRELLKGHHGFDFEENISDEQWDMPVTNKEKFCKKKNIPYFRIIAKTIQK